jgi:pimeloyl-ACP methyl ester carboxylesterase
MPDSAGAGGQAGFHCERGWIFVACDHLGVGDSTVPKGAVTFENIAAANNATVVEVLKRLKGGTLASDFPPVAPAVVLGIGQSMGGCFAIVLQGQYNPFDGVGVLGFSSIHTVTAMRPGAPVRTMPWVARRSTPENPLILNRAALAAGKGGAELDLAFMAEGAAKSEHPLQWIFHYDDEPAEIVNYDMMGFAGLAATLPPWRSAAIPTCAIECTAPGVVAQEAASITVPVLVAAGERDTVSDPWMEPKAYKSSPDITVYVCPRMAHMHNFAHTRFAFWQRIHSWGSGIAAMRALPAAR